MTQPPANDDKQHNRPNRTIVRQVRGVPASDGAGVQLTRIIGTPDLGMIDPFLLLDAFASDNPDDYIAGFPPHPHRGFETVTYLLAGRMRHKDNTGREGVIEPGGVQWMTAGRGIVHSEMPEQEDGLLHGFQLWVNLPTKLKMTEPRYREFSAADIPLEHRNAGVTVRVITGITGNGTQGPVKDVVTDPLYLDVSLPLNSKFTESIPASHNVFIYVISGEIVVVGENGDVEQSVRAQNLALFGSGGQVRLIAGEAKTRLLLIAGRRLDEPVARGGPFVMNTRAEVQQAFADYQAGRF